MYEAGNDHGNRFQKVEQMFDEWAAHGQPICSVFGLLKIVPGLCELDQKHPCFGCRKLFEVNVLICVGMDRLMNEICVLAGCHNYMEYNCVYRPLEMEL